MPTRQEFDEMRAKVRSDREAVQRAQSALAQSEFALGQAEYKCPHRDDTTYEFEEIIEPERVDSWAGIQPRRATGTYRKVAIQTCRHCGRVQRTIPPF